MLIILTGASGSGKRLLLRRLLKNTLIWLASFTMTLIGVPTTEEMIAACGSIQEHQRVRTHEWFNRLEHETCQNQLFEGQTRIAFLLEALGASVISEYRIILVDCDDETRMLRLTRDRDLPRLENMSNWAAYLRREADTSGIEIIDTTHTLSLFASIKSRSYSTKGNSR